MNIQKIKLWWNAFFSWNSLLRIFESFGVLWLIIEASSFFSQDLGEWFKGIWWVFLTIGIIFAIISTWPRLRINSVVTNRDVYITIAVTDIFNEKGDIIIPSNTAFDTDIQSGLISPRSVQGQFTNKYVSSITSLNSAIESQLTDMPFRELTERKGKQKQYEIGTVCRIETTGPTAYMVAICHMNKHGTAEGQFQYIQDALPRLWQFIAQRGQKEKLCIPIVGSGFSRVSEKREKIIKEIIKSFIASCAESTFCDDLVICIHPSDFLKHKIDLVELKDFLTYQCRYTDFSGGLTQGIGTEVQEE